MGEAGHSIYIWARRLLPWIIALVVVALLLHRYPAERIAAELARGDWPPLIAYALGAVIIMLAMAGLWDGMVLSAALGPIRYSDIMVGKAATAMLLAVAYGAGHGAYGVWIARKTGSDIRTTLGVILYLSLSDATALAIIASVTIWVADDTLPAGLRATLGVLVPALAVALLLAGLAGPRLLGARARVPRVVKPWAAVPALVYLATTLGRGLGLVVYMLATWAAANAFGLDMPLLAAMTYLPVILVAAALPINVGGFGAVQAAWLLFAPWAPGERILAFQFSWHVVLTGALAARGMPFLPAVLRQLQAGKAANRA